MYPKAMPISARFLSILFFSLTMSASVLADVREKQVQIESKLVEVSNSQTRELGVDWRQNNSEMAETRGLEHLGQSGNFPKTQSVFDFKPLDFSPPQSAPIKIVSAPQVQLQKNEPAKIATPVVIPVISQIQNNEPAKISTPIQLNVVPVVGDDGQIKMKVRPEVSEFDMVNQQVFIGIQIADGQTVVVGGLVQENPQENENKVPSLDKTPLIGQLFKRQNKPEKKDLTIFITPTIIQSKDE